MLRWKRYSRVFKVSLVSTIPQFSLKTEKFLFPLIPPAFAHPRPLQPPPPPLQAISDRLLRQLFPRKGFLFFFFWYEFVLIPSDGRPDVEAGKAAAAVDRPPGPLPRRPQHHCQVRFSDRFMLIVCLSLAVCP